MKAVCSGVAARAEPPQGSGDAKHRWKGGGGEEEGGGVVTGAGRRDEHPAFVLLGLVLIGDEAEAEHLRESGDRLIIVADDERDVGEGLGHMRT